MKPGVKGRGGLFQKTAKSCLISSNGSEALKLFPGQPHRMISAATLTLSACPGQRFKAMGAFYER